MPSLKIRMPNFWTTSRTTYSCMAFARRESRAPPTAIASKRSTPATSSGSDRASRRSAYSSTIVPTMSGSTRLRSCAAAASSRDSTMSQRYGLR